MLHVLDFLRIAVALAIVAPALMAHGNLGAAKTEEPRARIKNNGGITGQDARPRGLDGEKLKYFIPPGAIDFEWDLERYVVPSGNPVDTEYAIEVTHIKFDHAAGHATDGMDIRWNMENDLEHKGEGAGTGEYVAEEGSGANQGRNDPVLWLAGATPTVKIRFKLKQVFTLNPLTYQIPNYRLRMMIWATNLWGGCPYLDLGEVQVEFYDNGNGEYVSRVPQSAEEYIEFQMGTIPDEFADHIARYEFFARDFESWSDFTGSWSDTSPQYPISFDKLARIDGYSVLAAPTAPWGWPTSSSQGTARLLQHPWVSALAYICYPGDCGGMSNINHIADRLTEFLFTEEGWTYEHVEGRAGYANVDSTVAVLLGKGRISLTRYMAARFADRTCNCDDQACALTALLNLVQGGVASVGLIKRFGYVYATDFVGGENANNPFFKNFREFFNSPITGQPAQPTTNLTDADFIGGKKARSRFGYHAVCLVGDAVADACIGPVKIGDQKDVEEYLSEYRDNSTASENGPMLWMETPPAWANVGTESVAKQVYIFDLD